MNTFIEKHQKLLLIGGVFLATSLFLLNFTLRKETQKSKAAGETVTLSFNPGTATAKNGVDTTVTLQASSPIDIAAQGYQFDVAFDKSKLTVKSMQYKLGDVTLGLGDHDTIPNDPGDPSTLTAVNANGVIKVRGEIRSATGQLVTANQKIDVVSITFTSKTDTGTAVSVNSGPSTSIYRVNADSTITSLPFSSAVFNLNGGSDTNPTAVPTSPASGACSADKDCPTGYSCKSVSVCPTAELECHSVRLQCVPNTTITPGPGAGGNVNIDLTLRFQGIVKKPQDQYNTMNVKVTLMNEQTQEAMTSIGTFTAGDNGFWHGTASFNLPPNMIALQQKYKILIKGPKHLQKKICDAQPTETFPGSYSCNVGNISIVTGKNTFDFSGIYQLVGDLPEQDGIVNSFDTSLVLNSIGKSDADSLRVADLNLDGIVNYQDFSLIIAALSVRADEE